MPTKQRAKRPPPTLSRLAKEITAKVAEVKALRPDFLCYPMLIRASSIGSALVDDVERDLSSVDGGCPTGKLTVIIDSSGGDIHAAYNLGNLLRSFGTERLEFIVPRWAKSAATLLCCAGDKIWMSPTAELGPLDPQITQFNPMENRMERFSPLHIESTLELIREEYQNGNQQLADKLMERLQFPLTLGSIKKSLDGIETVR